MNQASPRALQTRQRVLDVAARQFRAHGYAGVSLRAIATEAGMKAGSLYYHFDSKETIVSAVLDIGIERVHAHVAGTVDGLASDVQAPSLLRTAIGAHLAAFHLHGDYTSANVRIFGQVPASVRRANLPARRRYDRWWEDLLARLVDDGALRSDLDIRSSRLLLIGAMNSSLDWFDPKRGDLDALAARYADIVLFGMMPHPVSRR